MKNRAIMLLTIFLILYAGFNLPSCESDVEQIAMTEEHIKEAMALAAPIKEKIRAYHSLGQVFPNHNRELEIPNPAEISGKAVHSIRVYGGIIIVKFKKSILHGASFEIKPTFSQIPPHDIEWICTTEKIDQKYFYNIEPPCLFTASENMEDLMNGVHQRDYEKVDLALGAGADINSEFHGETPLMQAISRSRPKMAAYLIEQGADVELGSQYYNYRTPLMFAVRNASFEIVKLLVENGADVNAKHKSGKRVVNFVEYNRKVLEYLYENGAEGGPEQQAIDVF